MQKFDTETLVASAGIAQSAAKKANDDIDLMQSTRAEAIELIRQANEDRDTAIESVKEAKRTIGTVGDLAEQLVEVEESFPDPIPMPPPDVPLSMETVTATSTTRTTHKRRRVRR